MYRIDQSLNWTNWHASLLSHTQEKQLMFTGDREQIDSLNENIKITAIKIKTELEGVVIHKDPCCPSLYIFFPTLMIFYFFKNRIGKREKRWSRNGTI